MFQYHYHLLPTAFDNFFSPKRYFFYYIFMQWDYE